MPRAYRILPTGDADEPNYRTLKRPETRAHAKPFPGTHQGCVCFFSLSANFSRTFSTFGIATERTYPFIGFSHT